MKDYEEMASDVLRRIQSSRQARKRRQKWLGAGAAACCLAALVGIGLWQGNRQVPGGQGDQLLSGNPAQDPVVPGGNPPISTTLPGTEALEESQPAFTMPKMEVSLGNNSEFAADMVALFIYQGDCYVECLYMEGPEAVGDYVATATGLIDEWTDQGGYVELAGSVAGDIYEVPGMNPEFMLCMRHDDGWVQLFCNNDIVLYQGSDLFEEQLHLAGHIQSAAWQTRQSWFYGTGEIYDLPASAMPVLDDFVAALNQAQLVYLEDILLEEGQQFYDDTELYQLFLTLDSGIPVHLRLFEGGYVQFQGLNGICAQVDMEPFQALVEAMQG